MGAGQREAVFGEMPAADARTCAAAYREALSILCLWDKSLMPSSDTRRSMLVAMMSTARRDGIDLDRLTLAALAGSRGERTIAGRAS